MRFVLILIISISLNAGNLGQILNNLNNYEPLIAKDLQTKSALAKKDEVFYKYLPSVSIEGNYIDFAKDRLVILPKHTMSASLVVEALLYDGARYSNIKLASKNYELNQFELQKSKNEAEFNLVKLYYTYLALDDNIEYKKKNIEYLNASLDRLSKLTDVGLKPIDELEIFRARVELEKIELEQFLHNKNEILSKIYLMTNEKITPLKGSFIEYNLQDSNSIDVKINEIKANMSELNKNAAYSEFLPKIFIKNMTILSKSKYDFSEFGALEPLINQKIKEKMTSNIFMIGFKWNLFSFGADKKHLESARLESLAAKQMLNYSKRLNEENIKLQIQEIDILNKEIKANEARVKASENAFNSILKKYEAGLLGYVEYLNAMELNYAANAALSLAKSKLEISKSKLLLELGNKISESVRN